MRGDVCCGVTAVRRAQKGMQFEPDAIAPPFWRIDVLLNQLPLLPPQDFSACEFIGVIYDLPRGAPLLFEDGPVQHNGTSF